MSMIWYNQSVCGPSLASLYRRIPSYKEGCDVISVIAVRPFPPTSSHIHQTIFTIAGLVLFYQLLLMVKNEEGLEVLFLRSCFLGWAWASPILVRLHCAHVCMLVGLLVAISASFKWAHVNISQRLYVLACNLWVKSVKGYCQSAASSVKETRRSWCTDGKLLVCSAANYARPGQAAHRR